MKIRNILYTSIFALVLTPLYSTQQEPDIIYIDNHKAYLETHWQFLSPLEIYYDLSKYKNPFKELGTANYRGFTATWKADGSKLLLTGLKVSYFTLDDDLKKMNIPLKNIFFSNVKNNEVVATWFTGVIKVRHKQDYIFLNIEKGIIRQKISISGNQYFLIYKNLKVNQNEKSDVTNGDIAKNTVASYFYYIENQSLFKSAEIPKLTLTEQMKAFAYMDAVYKKINQERMDSISEFKEKGRREAELKYKVMKGYGPAQKIFNIDDSGSGYFSTFPYSVEINLTSKKYAFLKIDWYVPIKNNTPQYDWTDLIKLYGKLEKIIQSNEWLLEWARRSQKQSKNRYIRLTIVGVKTNTAYDFQKDVYKPWQHAGMMGVPAWELMLYNDNHFKANVYFAEGIRYAIVLELNYGVGSKDFYAGDFDPKGNDKFSWYNKLSFFYNAKEKIPHYILIEHDGKWKINRKN